MEVWLELFFYIIRLLLFLFVTLFEIGGKFDQSDLKNRKLLELCSGDNELKTTSSRAQSKSYQYFQKLKNIICT